MTHLPQNLHQRNRTYLVVVGKNLIRQILYLVGGSLVLQRFSQRVQSDLLATAYHALTELMFVPLNALAGGVRLLLLALQYLAIVPLQLRLNRRLVGFLLVGK